jgi:hypothetical protein
MIAFFKKHSTLILISLLLTLLILAWLFPSAGLKLGAAFLLGSLGIASFIAIENHRKAYVLGRVTRGIFIRNAVLEILGILFAMVLAGLLGRFVAEITTRQISHELTRILAGVLTGLLVGVGVGAFAKRTWGRFVKFSPEPRVLLTERNKTV